MTTCPHCGKPIAADAETCPHCGGSTVYKARSIIVSCLGFIGIIIGTTIGAAIGNVNTAIIAAFVSAIVVVIAGVWWLSRQ